MALFHFNVTPISRGKGRSAVASAAYIAGEKIYDEYYGKTHDYTKKRDTQSQEKYPVIAFVYSVFESVFLHFL